MLFHRTTKNVFNGNSRQKQTASHSKNHSDGKEQKNSSHLFDVFFPLSVVYFIYDFIAFMYRNFFFFKKQNHRINVNQRCEKVDHQLPQINWFHASFILSCSLYYWSRKLSTQIRLDNCNSVWLFVLIVVSLALGVEHECASMTLHFVVIGI